MLKSWMGALAGVASMVLLAGPVAQAQPTTDLGKWYCSVLGEDFDPQAAIAAFPLEKLKRAKETREKDDDTTHVELISKGDEYEVTYAYSFNEDDVNDLYGFRLSVDEGPDMEFDDREMMLWLTEFGAPEKDFMGYAVGAGPKSFAGADHPFAFEVWTTGRYSVSWFEERDIRHSAKVCAGAKPVAADAVLANDMTVGAVLDRKTDKVSQWFCTVLKTGFDPQAAITAFPLETMPAPKETREKGDDITSVTLASQGDEFTVEYRYQYLNEDNDQTYGYGLYIQPRRASFQQEAMAWLRGFGKPVSDGYGMSYHVGTGQDVIDEEPSFKFAAWDSLGMRSAQWFLPGDIKLAGELCR